MKWILLLIAGLMLAPSVMAHCPLCTGAAIAGVSISRNLGVDDSIFGLLLGAVIGSTALWFDNILRKRKINFRLQAFALILVSFLLFAVPLYYKGVITDFEMVMSMPEHHSMLGLGIYGIDKLLFGMILGTLVTTGIFGFSDYLKERNGKRLFAYQGLIFMILGIGATSLILLGLI